MGSLIDIHSHITPGVDDGSENMEMSMQMLHSMMEQGCYKVFATPHSSAFDYLRENRERTYSMISLLQETAVKNDMPVQIYPGCEIYTSPGFMDDILHDLRSGQYPSMNGTKYVLAEFSVSRGSFEDARSCLKAYLEEGWIPIIAHAERYCRTFASVSGIAAMKELGCLVQVNLYDLDEEPDREIRKLARDLLSEELVDMVGSDAHRMGHRAPAITAGLKYIEKHCRSEYAEKVLWKNAEQLLMV